MLTEYNSENEGNQVEKTRKPENQLSTSIVQSRWWVNIVMVKKELEIVSTILITFDKGLFY